MTTATNVDAEVGVLGAILLNPTGFGDCNGLKGEHFYRPQHQTIWDAAKTIVARGDSLDATILASELEKDGTLTRIGGAPYLHTLISEVPSVANVGYYARIVHDQWKLRQLGDLGTRFKQLEAGSDASEITEALETARQFLDEADWAESSADDFDTAFRSWVDWYETETVAIPTPWQGINSAILGGWHRGRLYVVAGRPGAGKSALTLQALLHGVQSGCHARMYSLEMPSEECLSRVLSAGTGVPLKNVFLHRLSMEDREKVERFGAQPFLRRLRINDTPSQTIESIMAECRIAKQREGLDIVAIDHSLLLDPSDRKMPAYQQVSWIAKRAKLLARRLDVAVLLCHQLNRSLEYEARQPRLSDLKEGGEADADVVMVLTRSDDGITSWILKNRMGATGIPVTMADELRYARLG